MRTSLSRLPLQAALLILTPGAATAQFDVLERLVSKVEALSLYYQLGGLSPGSDQLSTSRQPGVAASGGLSGFGVELAIEMGRIPGRWEMTDSECAEEISERGTVDTVDVYTETRTVDERTTATTVVRTRPRAKLCQPPDLASLQLALGYSQLRGFRLLDPEFSMHTALAEEPAVALYLAFRPDSRVSPYLGLRAGRATLQSLRVVDENGTLYGGSTSTLQAGVAAGLAVTVLGIFDLVVEPSYLVRNFASIEWRTISGSSEGNLSRLPGSLNMSGWLLSLSLDFSIPRAS